MIKTILDILVFSVPIVSFLTCIFPMIFDRGKKIVNSIRKRFGSVHENNEIKQNVVENLLSKKIKRNNFALILLSVCFLAYRATGSLSIVEMKNEVAICLSLFIFCVLIFNLLIRYRISKSYYGTNYEEAKELIYLFKEDSDKNGKNTGKKLFTDINDQVNAKEIVPVPDSQWQY